MEKFERMKAELKVQAAAQETSDLKREVCWFCTQMISVWVGGLYEESCDNSSELHFILRASACFITLFKVQIRCATFLCVFYSTSDGNIIVTDVLVLSYCAAYKQEVVLQPVVSYQAQLTICSTEGSPDQWSQSDPTAKTIYLFIIYVAHVLTCVDSALLHMIFPEMKKWLVSTRWFPEFKFTQFTGFCFIVIPVCVFHVWSSRGPERDVPADGGEADHEPGTNFRWSVSWPSSSKLYNHLLLIWNFRHDSSEWVVFSFPCFGEFEIVSDWSLWSVDCVRTVVSSGWRDESEDSASYSDEDALVTHPPHGISPSHTEPAGGLHSLESVLVTEGKRTIWEISKTDDATRKPSGLCGDLRPVDSRDPVRHWQSLRESHIYTLTSTSTHMVFHKIWSPSGNELNVTQWYLLSGVEREIYRQEATVCGLDASCRQTLRQEPESIVNHWLKVKIGEFYWWNTQSKILKFHLLCSRDSHTTLSADVNTLRHHVPLWSDQASWK